MASDGQIISSADYNPNKMASSGEITYGPPNDRSKNTSDFSSNPSKAASTGPTKATSAGQTKAAPDDGGIMSALLKKCGGLPLAIIIVAGLVASKLRSGTSLMILDAYLRKVDKDLSGGLGTNLTTEGVTKILDRCYNDLPAGLKTCLLYLSMFPKGCFISRKRLIRRWIAEGFIVEKHGKNVEEVAEDCFNELISRNLIRAVNNSSNGKVKNYQIHDMVLEYVVSKSSDENFITVVGGHWQTPFPSYKILQVLDLEFCRDLSPHQLKKICKLHQLKYLSLRQTDIDEIPSEIGNKSKRVALQLTEEITKMTTLQVLSGVEICGSSTSSESRAWSKESVQDLEKLTNLKKLSIYILGKLGKSDKESLLSAIEHLSSCSLKSLAIDDDFTGFLEHSLNSSEAPPEHLHSLELSGMLSKLPKWIERLHSLEKLTLSLTSLTTDTLEVLTDLPELFSLTFSLDAVKLNNPSSLTVVHKNTLESGGEIFVPIGGFEKLKLLRFMAPILPPISFPEGAMPVLERLELKFRAVDGVHGLDNLASLRQVFLTVSGKAPKAAEEIKGLANKMKNPPTVIVDEYNESSM
ncbi:hypothetical protein QYE76_060112 [Lolium multiflorum]|uniref:Uncharacterized protein n=1 Tax=Lolium multiflorum TaxID=4521 RepID=A0AAD8RYG0_LOLMU|nr:hypothetical protein QYE76_060112 [Lolium multiflorum]